MLIVDGAGIVAAYILACYYKPPYVLTQPMARKTGIYLVFVLSCVMCAMFIALTISDTLVIMGVPQTWATLPIVRGHVGRVPLVATMLWMIYKQHVR